MCLGNLARAIRHTVLVIQCADDIATRVVRADWTRRPERYSLPERRLIAL
jgi:hypothetical protein